LKSRARDFATMSLSTKLKTWFSPEAAKRAQTAESRGELEGAVSSYIQAGRYGDAVRVMLVRAQGEHDPQRRALILAQASSLAPVGDPARVEAWRARATFIMDRAEAGVLDATIRRRELLDAGRALRDLGDPELAARALHIAGDLEGEISALADAGSVQKLEEAVARQRRYEEARSRQALRFEEARDLIAIGRRRDAMELLKASLKEQEAEDLRALLEGLLARRPRLPAAARLDGRIVELVAGNPVTLGRADGELRVPSPVVSRRHLEFQRRDNLPWVRDLGGKNGTTVRGARFDALPIGAGLDLLVGNALPIKVRSAERGGIFVEVPGRVCWCPLGTIELGGVRVTFELLQQEGWLQLTIARGSAIVLGDLRVEGAIQLIVGDELRATHGGPLLLRIVPPPSERP
jgi:tetratricopeptide (TPR) repeat protein